MPMTKAEKARVAYLEERAALIWTVPPSPITGERIRSMTHAGELDGRPVDLWTYNAHCVEVREGWTDGYRSSWGKHLNGQDWRESRCSTSVGIGGPWFHTRQDAARALRHAMEQDVARKLAAIDRLIAEDEQGADADA